MVTILAPQLDYDKRAPHVIWRQEDGPEGPKNLYWARRGGWTDRLSHAARGSYNTLGAIQANSHEATQGALVKYADVLKIGLVNAK